jgi:hypothetical protein
VLEHLKEFNPEISVPIFDLSPHIFFFSFGKAYKALNKEHVKKQ